MAKKKYRDWSEFDMAAFLDEYNVEWSDVGKNIGTGYIGLEYCPFCEAPGCHFGIRMETNVGSCWVCGETAGAPTLVKEITQAPWNKVYEIMNNFMDSDRWIPATLDSGDIVMFPENISDLNPQAETYLRGRNFNPDLIKKTFKIRSTAGSSYLKIDDNKWNFNYRVIIPIIMERTVVAYTGRSYADQEPRYMNSPTPACLIPPASCLYNVDTLTDKGIFVEGPTDVWRLGTETVAMMGVNFTKEQIAYLGRKDIKRGFVLFDEKAEEKARELAMALSSVIPSLKVITLTSGGDPGKMTIANAMKLKYELLGRI